MNDLKFAFRQLHKKPGFTAVAVLTMALGIGINSAMFSVLKRFLFYPLPFPSSARLAEVSVNGYAIQSAADFLDERQQSTVLSHLAAFQNWLDNANLSMAGGPAQSVNVLRTSGNFLATLEVPPLLGRTLTHTTDEPGRNQVVLLSDRLWKGQFHGDTNIVGRTVRLDGIAVTILGVLPPDFECRPLFGGRVDLVQPIAMTPRRRRERVNESVEVVGRLRPGVSMSRARAEMSAIGQRLKARHPHIHSGAFYLETESLGRSLWGPTDRQAVRLLFALAVFILLIACANLANLQLTRMVGRARELGIRAALGAGRSRVVRQLMSENLVMSLLGGTLALAFTFACDRLLAHQLSLVGGSTAIDIPVSWYVVGFCLLTAVIAAILAVAAPAWLMTRAKVNPLLKEAAPGVSAGRLRHRLQSGFVVIQLILALSLLAASGQVAVGLLGEVMRAPGWRPDGLAVGHIRLAGPHYDSAQKRRNFFAQLDRQMGALPGVGGISWCSEMPFQYDTCWPIRMEGRGETSTQQTPTVFWHGVGPNYFKTMGMTLRQGRAFTRAEIEDSSPVVIINQAMAKRFWPGTNPVGQRVAWVHTTQWLTVVGVVDDVAGADECHAYRPSGAYASILVIRSGLPFREMAPALRQAAARIDPALPVLQLESAARVLRRSQASQRMLEGLIIAFGILGFLLALVGVYGVSACTASQRAREFAIRMALGAQRGQVRWLVLRRGFALALWGAPLGIAGAVGILRVLGVVMPIEGPAGPARAVFAGISQAAWLIALGAGAVLMLAAILACWLPARRAMRVDPMEALRYE